MVTSERYVTTVQQALGRAPVEPRNGHHGLRRAAEYMRYNHSRPLELAEICAAANLSPSYLIRAFKRQYGLTPHAYLTNCRVEFSRAQLRRGRPIAEYNCAPAG